MAPGVSVISLSSFGGRTNYALTIPGNLDATITVGKEIIPVNGLIELGLIKKAGKGHTSYLLKLPHEQPFVLASGNLSISFNYADAAKLTKEASLPKAKRPKIKYEKIDKSLRKKLIPKEDYAFYYLSLALSFVAIVAMGLLSTIEIKKTDDIEVLRKMPARFARLITEPPKPKKVEKPKAEEAPVAEEKVSEAPAEEPKEAAKEEAPVEKAAVEKKAAIRKKVMSKGLLSVIGGRGMPDALKGLDVLADVRGISSPLVRTEEGRLESDEMMSRYRSEEFSKMEEISKEVMGGTQVAKKTAGEMKEEILKEKKDVVNLEGGRAGKKGQTVSSRMRDEAEVYKTIRGYVGGLKYLYNNAIRDNPFLKGKITVKITISADGKVASADLVSSTLDSQELRDAILSRILKWKFSRLKDVETFTITYTFDFAPVS
ncbi:MAG: AgmX/PglI C-terminal domain-containing protein [Deltaproteobacteria bacterium]